MVPFPFVRVTRLLSANGIYLPYCIRIAGMLVVTPRQDNVLLQKRIVIRYKLQEHVYKWLKAAVLGCM